ncbi:hypothetical protein L1887_32624 [Cichorium endivia]|nr:hypothetical protein L1887_32624 [Cichorium endivia]
MLTRTIAVRPSLRSVTKQVRRKRQFFSSTFVPISSWCFHILIEKGYIKIIGGAVVNDGSIADMKTGEGKTLVSTLATYLNALTGEGAYVVTIHDYLAYREAEGMGAVAAKLGELLMHGRVFYFLSILFPFDVSILLYIFITICFTTQHYNIQLKGNPVELTGGGIALAEMALETIYLWTRMTLGPDLS